MPYKSLKQAAYFNIHKKELEAKGVNVEHWNRESKGMNLKESKKSNSKHKK